MNHEYKNGAVRINFDSTADIIACAENPAFRSAQYRGNRGFTMVSSFAEAKELSEMGWPDGLKQAEELRATIVERIAGSQSLRPRLTRSFAGFAPCIPAAISGDPESMFNVRSQLTPSTGKVIRIMFNIDVSGGIECQTMIFRGAVGLALIDLLESSGFRCEIVMGMAYNGGGSRKDVRTFVTLKQAEDSLNMDSIAYWFSHPSSFRTVHASAADKIMAEHYKESDSWAPGRPSEYAEEDKGDIYLCGAYLANVDNNTAVPFLRNLLSQQGVQFDESTN